MTCQIHVLVMSHEQGFVMFGVDCGRKTKPSMAQDLRIPSAKLTYLWNITSFNGKIHYKLPFSIAMFSYQRIIIILGKLEYSTNLN